MDSQNLFKYNPIPNFVYDLNSFQILDINNSAIKHYGYSKKELLSMSIKDLILESEISLEDDKDIEISTHFKKNGQEIKMKVYSHELIFKGKKATMISCIDVTEREKRILKIQNLENKLKTATSIANLGYWKLELETNTLTWSDEVYKIWCRTKDTFDLSFENFFNTIHEDDRESFLLEQDALFSIDKDLNFVHRILLPNNTVKWVHQLGRIIKNEQKEIIAFEGTVQDITLQKEEEHRLKLLESITDAFYSVDKKWNFTYFNKESENLFKQKSSEILGKNIWSVFYSIKGTEIEKVYKRVAKNDITESFEYYFPRYNSWYEIKVYPSKGGISAYFKNINEKKRVVEELKKLYEEKNRILESIGDAFFTVDRNFIVSYWNKVAEQLLGVKREEILGRNLWEVFPDAVNLPSYKNYKLVLEKNKPIIFEDFYGVWLEINAYPNEEGLTVLLRDISHRKEADLIIREANERFTKVAEATEDAIWDWDIQKDHFYRGQGFKNIFGEKYLSEMSESDFWKDCFHEEDLPMLIQSVNDAVSDPTISNWQLEYRVRHSSGKIKTVLDKGLIIRDKSGKATRMVGAVTDISLRKEHEQELQRLNEYLNRSITELKLANEELEQFAFITSHDLQEPLRMITSFMGMIKEKYSDQLDEKANQYIYYAIDGAKRMKKIILDLLDYSRAGRIEEEAQTIDLNEFIENYKSLRRKVIEEKSVKLITNELPTIEANPSPMIQVFHALLDNAIKYSKPNTAPIVELFVKEEKEEWIFSIKDNGIGIDNQFLDKIFIIFQRLHNRDQYEGTGIGLAIVKKHVESWGGRIWVTSKVGKGSTFWFTLKK